MWKKLGFRTVAEHDGTVDFKQSNGNQTKLNTQAGLKTEKTNKYFYLQASFGCSVNSYTKKDLFFLFLLNVSPSACS